VAPDGSPVKSYSQLIEYLMNKHERIRAVELDFDGRNILLYYLPLSLESVGELPLVDPALPVAKIVRGVATAEIWRAIE
jgi:hypothetical protein